MIKQTNKSKFSISRDDILLSDGDILKRYLGISEWPCVMSSPLRDDDDRPSFSVFERENKIFWKDFGTGASGTIISLLAKLWHVGYNEALLKIKLDTENKIPKFDLIRTYKGKTHLTGNSSIKVKVRPWKAWDIEFWESFGIPKDFATWCNVFPISHAFFYHTDKETGKKDVICVPMDKYAYAYFEWKDDKESIKLYQPFSQSMKWLSKHDSSVWDLWRQAFLFAEKKSNDAVILTSSRKDAMCLWYNLGVPAMSLQGEGYVPKPQVMQKVFDTFKSVYIWYDNDFKHTKDNPGQDNAKKLIEMYPALKNICIPDTYQAKDPSDLFKEWGPEILKEIWNNQK